VQFSNISIDYPLSDSGSSKAKSSFCKAEREETKKRFNLFDKSPRGSRNTLEVLEFGKIPEESKEYYD
jgi:Ca2+-binding EF-hand superfamily protein